MHGGIAPQFKLLFEAIKKAQTLYYGHRIPIYIELSNTKV
jgi:hypothetical protein